MEHIGRVREVFEREFRGRSSLFRLARECRVRGFWIEEEIEKAWDDWDADPMEFAALPGELQDNEEITAQVFLVQQVLQAEDLVTGLPYAIPSASLDEWDRREWVRLDMGTREDHLAYARSLKERAERNQAHVRDMVSMMMMRFGKAPRVRLPDVPEIPE